MRIFKATLLAASLAVAGLSGPSFASDTGMGHAMKSEPVNAGDLDISGGWVRSMLPGQKVAGGFIVITNNGDADDRLVSVSTPAAPKSEIHEMAVVDDIMKRRALPDGLVIPAGETVELKPGGFHLMFMAVPEPFAAGDTVQVTLVFEKAGQVEMMLPVMKMEDMKAMKHD